MGLQYPDFKSVVEKIIEENNLNTTHIPSRKEIISILKDIQSLMFPSYFLIEDNEGIGPVSLLSKLFDRIAYQIRLATQLAKKEESANENELAAQIIEALPDVAKMLTKDVAAIYEGDPAATSAEEVVLSYPGFYAITIYRIAHEFYKRNIPLIPRLMTEYAHEKTGIDIHAGAKIGEYFFIDHGTGIVIGETTTIGDRVKIYQGVTLGARSFELDENGNPVKGIKRHPDIGNNVIIYANATILGGNTKIGDGAVIGGNVWLTHSVPAGEKIYYNN